MASESAFLDSTYLFGAASTRYARALAWMENGIGKAEAKDALWQQLRRMPEQDRLFFLRSCGIRATIDEMCGLLFLKKGEVELFSCYEHLRRPFDLYAARSRLSNGPLRINDWDDLGADLNHLLVEPLPFVLSAWSSEEYPKLDGWNEAGEVRTLFNRHMAHTVGLERCVLREMSVEVRGKIEHILSFLQKFYPNIFNDIVCNVRHVCMIDFERWESMPTDEYREIGQSVSSHLVPSTCFFSYHSLGTIEDLMEALYHEALHKKLSNTILVHAVLKATYDSEIAPRFLSVWNRDTPWNSNEWTFDRALYAYHVYAHLFVFYGALLEQNHGVDRVFLSADWCANRREVAGKREALLGNWILEQGTDLLDETGVRLMQTLRNCVSMSHARN